MTKPSIVRATIAVIAAGLAIDCISSVRAQTCADHGVPQIVGGAAFPNWQERATLVLTNACRTAPVDYRNFYLAAYPTILQPATYPAVGPVQWNVGLNRSSRAHSIDMATTPCFQHNSCNGTDTFVRISSYYPNYSTAGENIAAGYADPLASMTGWLLDANASGVPAADGATTDGHRRNIMYSAFNQLGCGYAAGGPYGKYWTQDFARPQTAATVCSPIAAGSHIKQGTNINFLVTFYDTNNAAPQSASVVINGVSTPLLLHLGTAAKGTYRLSTVAGTACRSYHFEIRDAAGVLWKYPAHGNLRTFGEGTCAEDFVDSVTPPPCPADFDASGGLATADIFAYLNSWFAGEARADFNGGGLAVGDIFAFLNAWFAGC